MKRFVFIVKTETCALDKVQNKFTSGVLLNICSASFQHICRKTSIPKGNLKKKCYFTTHLWGWRLLLMLFQGNKNSLYTLTLLYRVVTKGHTHFHTTCAPEKYYDGSNTWSLINQFDKFDYRNIFSNVWSSSFYCSFQSE